MLDGVDFSTGNTSNRPKLRRIKDLQNPSFTVVNGAEPFDDPGNRHQPLGGRGFRGWGLRALGLEPLKRRMTASDEKRR